MRSGLISLGVLVLGVAALVVIFDVPLNDPVWWVTNETPPSVTVGGPVGTVRGTVEARVGLEPAARAKVASVRVDDQVRDASDGRIVLDTTAMSDGQHRVEVVAHDTSRHQNLGRANWTFVSDNTPPKLDIALDPVQGPQEGHTLVVRVRADEPMQDVRATLDGQSAPLQSDGMGGFWLLAGVAPGATAEKIGLSVGASDGVGNATEQQREWPIRHRAFPEDDLDMAPSAADMTSRAVEDQQLAAIYGRPDGARQWDGAFRTPVAGDVTTAFGTHRSYEYHPGMDFGVAMGTPVAAPANGTVAFVGSVPARGNVVILDHGAGVYSTYAHLQEASVREGSTVKAGQTIAKVGSTGFSTGPHLHWEIWVDGANVDPLEWTRRAFP